MSSEESNEMEVEDVAIDVALDGVDDVEDGLDSLDLAGDVAAMATGEAMAGAADLTRAVDAEVVADRLATLADVVGDAGVNDLTEGAELLMAADDVDAMSAAMGLMSLGDMERGLELGGLAGELQTIANVVDTLEMPVLSSILDDRGWRLQQIASDVILRSAAERGLSALMEATGLQIADLGAAEMDEGELRLAASDLAAQRAGELAAAGLVRASRARLNWRMRQMMPIWLLTLRPMVWQRWPGAAPSWVRLPPWQTTSKFDIIATLPLSVGRVAMMRTGGSNFQNSSCKGDIKCVAFSLVWSYLDPVSSEHCGGFSSPSCGRLRSRTG